MQGQLDFDQETFAVERSYHLLVLVAVPVALETCLKVIARLIIEVLVLAADEVEDEVVVQLSVDFRHDAGDVLSEQRVLIEAEQWLGLRVAVSYLADSVSD